MSKVCNKIDITREALISWSRDRFGSLQKRIEDIRARLAVFFDSSFSAKPLPCRLELES